MLGFVYPGVPKGRPPPPVILEHCSILTCPPVPSFFQTSSKSGDQPVKEAGLHMGVKVRKKGSILSEIWNSLRV